MTVSIIIPTFNGAHKIVALLDALVIQTKNDFEVIVVIDGSTDETTEVVAKQTARFQNLKIINQENKGRSGARNAGANAATGELLIFLDDDVEPLNNLVELHIQHHQSIENSVLVGQLFMDNRGSINDFISYRYFIEQKWNAAFQHSSALINLENYRFTSQNLSISKSLFFSFHGFDERLKDSEDFDFSMKLISAGIPVYYEKKIFAWHRDFTDIEGYINRMKAYKQSKSYLLEIHPEYVSMHPKSFEISRKPIGLAKQMISKLFIFNSFWKQFFQSKLFLNRLPQRIRFRCYELVIYSSALHD